MGPEDKMLHRPSYIMLLYDFYQLSTDYISGRGVGHLTNFEILGFPI